MVYAYGGVRALAGLRRPRFRLVVDGQPRELDGWSVVVGNSGRYGGGMRICPDARLDDGLLDLVTFGPVRRLEFAPILRRVFEGSHVGHRQITNERVRSVRVEVEGFDEVYADGDLVGHAPVEVTVRPGALRICA